MTAEFTYFADPQTDRLVSLVWQLAAELDVTRQRLAAVEELLVRSGAIEPGTVDAGIPDSAVRDDLLDRLMRVVTEYGPAEHPLRPYWNGQRGR